MSGAGGGRIVGDHGPRCRRLSLWRADRPWQGEPRSPSPPPPRDRSWRSGGRDGRDGRDGRAESARDRGPVSAAPFRPLTRSFSSCSRPYPAGSARLGSVRWDVWGSWDSSGRGVSKSATKAPRAGIGREEKPGISTILFRRSGAIGAFVADLDNLRHRGPLGEDVREPGGDRDDHDDRPGPVAAPPGPRGGAPSPTFAVVGHPGAVGEVRVIHRMCTFRRFRVSFPPVSRVVSAGFACRFHRSRRSGGRGRCDTGGHAR